uniref:SJCHGC02970 protein n=1 Tax=Schistosoma japonicum TaxID=6182 RepID=Q5DHV3_SCHJA|nr:SJCHGC02970 protein [Schistosoma japonicum]
MKFTTVHDHLIIDIIIVTLELCILLNVIKCQMTQEQLNPLNLLHSKLTNDPHNSRVFVKSQSKHSKNLMWNNTLQQYAGSHVKQFNPNVTLARQHYNNSLGVNISDIGDHKSAIMNNRQYQLHKNKLRRFYNYEMTTTEVPPETTSYLLEPGRCECIC